MDHLLSLFSMLLNSWSQTKTTSRRVYVKLTFEEMLATLAPVLAWNFLSSITLELFSVPDTNVNYTDRMLHLFV